MQRKIKVVLTTIPALAGIALFYVITNWEMFLDSAGFLAGIISSIQTQIWAVIALASFSISVYRKIRESGMPRKISQIMELSRLQRALLFFDSLMDRFTYQELIQFLMSIDTLSAEMKMAIHEITITLDGNAPAKAATPKTTPLNTRQKRKELANKVAELLRKVGHKVEVSIQDEGIFQKILPSPDVIRGKILSKFGRQLEDADARKQTRLRQLQMDLKNSQERLAQILSGIKEIN